MRVIFNPQLQIEFCHPSIDKNLFFKIIADEILPSFFSRNFVRRRRRRVVGHPLPTV